METQPAPLDGMSGKDGLDEFRISSPRDVGTLLKQLLDGAVVLSLHGSDGSVFQSAIWTMDSARATIGFNADPNDPAMQAIVHSHEPVTVVGYLDSVKVQFDVRHPVLVHGNRASVLSCPFPREMYRFQRRNAFRVRPLMRSAPVARLRHPGQKDAEVALRVIDLSIGGCALFLPSDLPSLSAGVTLTGVRMELDEDTKLDVHLRLQHVTSINNENRGVRLGCEFVRPNGDTLRTLQRFIDLTQKRGKLMALN
jgi:c-di-GMP-binding flagellar brake protein YcgR